MGKKIFLAILMISFYCNGESIEKIIELSAKIEKVKFFSYGIEEFKFDKEIIKLDFNKEQSKINDLNSLLVIKTSIPEHEKGFSYNIYASELESLCYDSINSSDVVYSNFANYKLNDKDMALGDKLHFNKFNNICDDETYCDELDFNVKFDETPINGASITCSGKVRLTIGLEL